MYVYIYNKLYMNVVFVAVCSYALPTKSTEVMLMQEQGTKMYVDSILKTHERVVQVKVVCSTRSLNAFS